MVTKIGVTIDEEYGQILLPLEVCQQLKLQNFDWFKVTVKSDQIVLSLSRGEVDEDLLEALVHEGVLIDVK